MKENTTTTTTTTIIITTTIAAAADTSSTILLLLLLLLVVVVLLLLLFCICLQSCFRRIAPVIRMHAYFILPLIIVCMDCLKSHIVWQKNLYTHMCLPKQPIVRHLLPISWINSYKCILSRCSDGSPHLTLLLQDVQIWVHCWNSVTMQITCELFIHRASFLLSYLLIMIPVCSSCIPVLLPRLQRLPHPFDKHWLGELGNMGSNNMSTALLHIL